MTHAAYIPAGVHSHGPLPLILLPQLSLLFLVFLCYVWSKQTANAGTALASLWAVSQHIIDNYENLAAAQPFLCKEKPSQTWLAKYSLEHYTARNPNQAKILSVVLNVLADFTPTASQWLAEMSIRRYLRDSYIKIRRWHMHRAFFDINRMSLQFFVTCNDKCHLRLLTLQYHQWYRRKIQGIST